MSLPDKPPVTTEDILKAIDVINKYKDAIGNLNAEVLRKSLEEFVKDHRAELITLGDKAIEIVYMILTGRLKEAEESYYEGVEGKSAVELLRSAREDFIKARQNKASFDSFIGSIGKWTATFIKGALTVATL